MLSEKNIKPVLVQFKSEVKEILGQLKEVGKQLQSEQIAMDLNTTIEQLDEESFTLMVIQGGFMLANEKLCGLD